MAKLTTPAMPPLRKPEERWYRIVKPKNRNHFRVQYHETILWFIQHWVYADTMGSFESKEDAEYWIINEKRRRSSLSNRDEIVGYY